MARRKRLCMISTKVESEQPHNEAQSHLNGHSTNETNDANSSHMDTETNEHSDNQNELGGNYRGIQVAVTSCTRYERSNESLQCGGLIPGSAVRIAGNVGLHFEDWRKVDKEKKEGMYSIAKAIFEQKKISHSKMEEPHVTGTKSFVRLVEEEAIKNNGVKPTQGKVYQLSRTRKDGSIVNEKAAQVMACLQVVADQKIGTPTDLY